MTENVRTELLPFTQPWADAFCAIIQRDATFREAGQKWSWPLALVLQATPQYGYPADTAALLDLKNGECRAATVMPANNAKAPFALRGPYQVWKQIVTGALDPVAAVMKGALKLDGSIMTLMQHTRFAKALVACAQQVPMRFPDEA